MSPHTLMITRLCMLCRRDALKAFSPRQLRIMFALQQWNKPMMYGEQAK
jgi:cysteinyl-tRNA synthetase